MKQSIKLSDYTPQQIQCGIVHIGVGGFHRAHQALYTHLLMEQQPLQRNWGICGVMLLPSDEALYNSLKGQECRYSLTQCSPSSGDEIVEVASIVDLMWAGDDWKGIVEKIADIRTKIISLTITEGGYNIDRATGEFDLSTPDIAADAKGEGQPKTVFGFMAQGLKLRMERGGTPVTILSCDNLQGNGKVAKRTFSTFFRAYSQELAEWAEKNVTYPNSMVDRITPATKAEDVERLNQASGYEDKAPVYCEDFRQWVIEDDFAAGRPRWEDVGAQFTSNVEVYEEMKLGLLNASHTLLSYPSFLAGYRKVDEAMGDENISRFVRTFMDVDITHQIETPPFTDLEEYKNSLVSRFANGSVSDQVSRLCGDGISKFAVYITPRLRFLLEEGADTIRMAYLLAAYRQYLKCRKDDKGEAFEIFEPWLSEEDAKRINSESVVDFLQIAPFDSIDFAKYPAFVESYTSMCEQIAQQGAMSTLKTIL